MIYKKEIDNSPLIQYIILFTLANVKKHIAYDTLLNLIMNNCNINFGEFQIALDNLIETEHIRSFMGEKKPMYEILQKGILANDFFYKNIPIYIRQPIKDSIKPILKEEIEKNRIKAEIIPITKSQFSAHCELCDDDNVSLLDLNFYAGTREDAVKICENFKQNPDDIYKNIMLILTSKSKENH